MTNDNREPGPHRYVTDEDFREAIRGREIEVLKALGIYTASWTPALQGDDIACEAMKIWGLADVGRAKFMITKHILHRDDLIRTPVAAGDGSGSSRSELASPGAGR